MRWWMGCAVVWGCRSDEKTSVDNAVPVAVITSHTGDEPVREASEETLLGSVSDDSDDLDSLLVTWFVNDAIVCDSAPPLEDGTTTCAITVPAAVSIDVRLEVRDPSDALGTDALTLDIDQTSAPEVELHEPTGTDEYYADEPFAFSATVTDAEDEAGDLVVWFETNLTGRIDLGGRPDSSGSIAGTLTMSEGTYQLTIWVEDTDGKTNQDSVTVIVAEQVNEAPVVTMTAPTGEDAYTAGDPISYAATVTDAEDAPSDLTLWFESSLEGTIEIDPTPDSSGGIGGSILLGEGVHDLTLWAQDSAGQTGSDTVTVTVSVDAIIDEAPTAPEIAFSPTEPRTADDFSAVITTPSTDPEGDTVTYTYAWQRNGVSVAESSDTVSSTETTKDDTWRVTVTPSDGSTEGPATTASVAIANTPPSVEAASITPSTAQTNDILSVLTTTADDDDEPVTVSIAWYVDGSLVGTDSTLAGADHFDKGDEITAIVTASDGTDEGDSLTTDGITIQNTAPSAPVVSIAELNEGMSLGFDGSDDRVDAGILGITGNDPRTLMIWGYAEPGASGNVNLLTLGGGVTTRDRFSLFLRADRRVAVVGEGYDADTDVFFPLNQWTHYAATHDGAELRIYIDGVLVYTDTRAYETDGTQPLIIGSNSPIRNDEFWKGQLADAKIWSRALSASDVAAEMVDGIITSASDLVGYWPLNDGAGSTAIDLGALEHHGTIAGGEWVEDDPFTIAGALVCLIDEESTDADEDPVSYGFEWWVDGVEVTDAETTTYAGDTVPGDAVGIVENWTCTVTPSDDEESGPTASSEITTEDPCIVARYDFDEGSGDLATDSSGNGLDGSIVGASWATGVVGSALDFSGGGSWVDLGSDPAFDIGADISIEAWVYVYGSTGDHQMVLSKWYEGGTAQRAYIMELQPDGVSLQMPLTDVSPDSVPGLPYHTDPIPWGEWVHVAATYDGTTERIYVNGIEDTAFDASGPLRITSANVFIGAHDSSGDRNGWNGLIDELRLYCRALSAEEVESHATID